jgi:hypothetical protein
MKTKQLNVKSILGGVAFIALVLALAAAGTWITMSLWNWIIPSIFSNAPELSFWQTYGLIALIDILFGGAKKLRKN